MLITNGKVFYDGELHETDLLIDNSKILAIGENLNGDQVLDVKGNIILPGLIDSHVHFCEPGDEHKEDWYTGSCAAAAGGVTTVLDMPNTRPPVLTEEVLTLKRQRAKKSIINYGFHFGSSGYNIDEIEKVENVASTSVYFDEHYDVMAIKAVDLLENIFLSSNMITCHANGEYVKTAMKLTNDMSSDAYLCSISTKNEIDEIKREGAKILIEVTPHHLFLKRDHEQMLKHFALVHPNLNYTMDHEALWQAINEDLVTTIASAHTPHTIEEKHSNNPPHGVPGVETMLPLLLNAVNERIINLAKVVELTSTNPAKTFNIKNKGEISEGFDADLVIIDLNHIKEVTNEDMHYKCGWTPYNGMSLKGWPVITIVNGNIVYYDGEIYDQFRGKEIEYTK